MKINLINHIEYYTISINDVENTVYKISNEIIRDFMSYLYVNSLRELENSIFLRFELDVNVTHKKIYEYITRNFLFNNTDTICHPNQYDYANEIIPKVLIDNKKQIIHKKALLEGVKFFFSNTQYNNGEVLFTGGTSLMLKYERENKPYYRFSLDIDFSFLQGKKVDEGMLLGEIMNTADTIISFLQESGCTVKTDSNWKHIEFECPGYGVAVIKIDYMPNYNCFSEDLMIGDIIIHKASDEDIVANKLRRLNERDIEDIKYLSNKIDIDKLIQSLKGKSKNDYGNEYAFVNKYKQLWEKQCNIPLIIQIRNHFLQ